MEDDDAYLREMGIDGDERRTNWACHGLFFCRSLSDEQQFWAGFAITVIAMLPVHAINKRRNS